MQIIFLTSASNSSGGARQAAYLAEELARRGHTLVFFTPADSSLRHRNFDVAWADLPKSFLTAGRALESRIKESEPCIVQAFHNRAVKLAAGLGLFWRVRHRPIACFGYRGVIFPPHNPFPYLSPGMAGFIANSQAAAAAIRRISLGMAKTYVIYNALPEKRLQPAQPAQDVRLALGIKEGDFVVGAISGNQKIKGVQTLLSAFADALKNGLLPAEAKLLVVGVLPDVWMPLCHEHGIVKNVRLLDQQNCVADYLQCMDVFVLASLSESSPNTLLEAMCMGLPVLASRVGGVPEFFPDIQKETPLPGLEQAPGALLFKPGDRKALAEALGIVEKNRALLRQMGASNFQRREEFSMGRRARLFEDIYERALMGYF